MQSVFDYGAERRGVTLVCKNLKEEMTRIEALESSGARRYKLLKYIVNNLLNNPDYLLKHRQIENFKYRFEDGKILVNNKEVQY